MNDEPTDETRERPASPTPPRADATADISYVVGDATRPRGEGPRVIVHVCNDIGGWGRGFVRALSARWPEPERAYRQWHRDRESRTFALGEVDLVAVEDGVWVANLIGQRGTRPSADGPPVRYPAIERGLATVAARARELGASVHMPRIGCGLAGGSWDHIEPILQRTLAAAGVSVTVYDLPA